MNAPQSPIQAALAAEREQWTGLSAPDNGGPAFPCIDNCSTRTDAYGMSLRDYFAAKAMHALITEPQWHEGASSAIAEWSKDSATRPGSTERYAFVAYRMADAMLKARNA